MKKNKLLLLLLVLVLASVTGCKRENPKSPDDPSNGTNEKPVRPHTHEYEYEVTKLATLFEKGSKKGTCNQCDKEEIIEYYYLDEVSFSNTTYQYNGKVHSLEIEGLLPVGIRVEYVNNRRSEVGTQIAIANFIDRNSNIVKNLEAALIVTAYKGLPRVDINTFGGLINSKEVYTTSTMSIGNCSTDYELINVGCGIRLRGNGTLEAAKKPYRIKFDAKENILGLNDGLKAKSWVLLAEYYDYSFLRNATAFMIGNSLFNYNEKYFCSDFEFVNLYINNVYSGVYVICEQSQVNKGRVEIYEPSAGETSTNIGYLVEIDQYAATEGDSFMVNMTGSNLKSDYYSLKSDYYSIAQKDYIAKYMNSVYEVLYNAAISKKYYELDTDFNLVPSTSNSCFETINKVIDVESFIRSYILEEIMKDIDVGYSSYYLCVDFSENAKVNRLTATVPWDFDWSSGNANGTYATNGGYNSTKFEHMNVWLYLISKCDFFQEMMVKYYTVFRESNVMEKVYDYQNYIAETFVDEFATNFRKWNVLGQSLHVYHSGDVYSIRSHQDAVTKLQTWLKARIKYLDSVYKGDK